MKITSYYPPENRIYPAVIILLAAVIFLSVAKNSAAQTNRWLFIGSSDDAKSYLDAQSLERRGTLVYAEYRLQFADDSYYIIDSWWNCAANQFRIERIGVHDRTGKIVKVGSDTAWTPIPPRSVADSTAKVICRWAEKTGAAAAEPLRADSLRVSVDAANLRELPRLDAEIYGKTLEGTNLKQIGTATERNWYLIYIGLGELAWVHGSTVEASGTALPAPSVWHYVMVTSRGGKAYLLDNRSRFNRDGNKIAWEKFVETDGSFIVSLGEWNCQKRLRRTRQSVFYQADGTLQRMGNILPMDWKQTDPGSVAESYYNRVCRISPSITALITGRAAALQDFPGENRRIVRMARAGEQFLIVPETGAGGWYNIVDEATQNDYWIKSDNLKIIDDAP